MEQLEQTISSLEIAEMMGVRHSDIIRRLEGRDSKGKHIKGIIEILAERQMALSDFFIPSTYQDSSGKENKCYKCTRMGCEFLANKFTGEKGIIFTARYVKRFHEMEQTISQQKAILQKQEKKKLSQWTPEEIVDWKLNDLNKRVKVLEKAAKDRPVVKRLKRLQMRKGTWYEKNHDRIWEIKEKFGVEPRKLYHIILEECGRYYDMDNAKEIYQDERGHVPVYAIDLVEYFPQLQYIADQVLADFEQ